MLYSRSRVYSNEVSQLFWRLMSALATSADESLRYSRRTLPRSVPSAASPSRSTT